MSEITSLAQLPTALDAERLVLGSLILDSMKFPAVANALNVSDFALEKHRVIWSAIEELDRHGERPDRVTVCSHLMRTGKLEVVDGMGYIMSLEDGMPLLPNLDGYLDLIIRTSRLRQLAITAQSIMDRALGGADTPEQVLEAAAASFNAVRSGRDESAIWSTPGKIIEDYPGGLRGIVAPVADATGIATPFSNLSEMVGGFKPGELIILAGRPSHGKSSAAMSFSWHAAWKQKIEVAYVSLEMSRASLVQRFIAMHGRAELHRLRSGFLTVDERSKLSIAASDVQEAAIWIDDRGGQSSVGIRRSIRQLAQRRPIGMIVVDHLHLIRGTNPREDERQRFNAIADDLQNLAKEMRVPVIALAQCSRKCEEESRTPGMSDLKETGKLEENADVIIFAYRPELYTKFRTREDLRGLAEFVVAKNRNGPVGTCRMVFIGPQARFDNRAQDV